VIPASNSQDFVTYCDSDDEGNNLWAYHEDALEDCLNMCAKWNGSEACIGVSFDAQLLGGWENCYLKNATDTIVVAMNITLARLSSNTNGSDTNGSRPSSKAWIAAPVVSVAVLATSAILVWIYLRKRRSRLAPSPEVQMSRVMEKAELSADERKEMAHGESDSAAELEGKPPIAELEGSQVLT
jgi:hypothetical protein